MDMNEQIGEGQATMDWALNRKEIAVSDLDAAFKVVVDKRNAYDDAKELSDAAYTERKLAEANFIDMMEKSGKTTWKIQGLGTMSVKDRQSVGTPKTPEEKKLLFNHIKDVLGEDFYWHYVSINANSLNSLYSEEFEKSEAKELFSLPGVGPVSVTKIVSLTNR